MGGNLCVCGQQEVLCKDYKNGWTWLGKSLLPDYKIGNRQAWLGDATQEYEFRDDDSDSADGADNAYVVAVVYTVIARKVNLEG